MRGMSYLLITLGAGYLLAVGLIAAYQRTLIYFPAQDRPSPDTYGAQGFDIVATTTEDGLRLTGWNWKPDTNGALVLYFHGNGGHLGHRAPRGRFLEAAGCGVLLAEYRGYGGNPGRPSETGLIRDAEAWLVFLAEQGIKPDRIILFGESLGAAVAVSLAAKARFRGLILEAPFTSLVAAGQHHYPWLPVALLLRDRFDSLPRIAHNRAPLLILHGEADRTVPVEHGRELLAAANEPKRGVFLPGADHHDVFEQGGAEAVAAFLDELCP